MKKKSSTEQAKDSEDQWPPAKLPADFTGVGREIISEPCGIQGDLIDENGRCNGVHAVSPSIESLPPSEFPKITAAQQIAWFNLTRKNQLGNPFEYQSVFERERAEERNKVAAERFGRDFAEAMFGGRLSAFIKQISRAEKAEQKRQQDRANNRKPKDGFRDALTAVAWHSSHPSEVTKSAVLDYLKVDSGFCKSYDINESMLSAREVKRHLKELGFGWAAGIHGRRFRAV